MNNEVNLSLQKLEDLKKRPGRIELEEITKIISEIDLPAEFKSYLIENLSREGTVEGPPGAIGFSPRKAIDWLIKELQNYEE